MEDFGTLLRRSRTGAGLSQETLAERAVISLQAVSALERGFRKAPYRDTVERLANALGLEAEARREFQRSAERARLRSGPEPPAETAAAQRNNLPPSITSFVGREDVLAEITALLESSRLITIVGSGGTGKTRVALEVARRALADWADGVWFVELAGIRDPTLVPNALASVVGAQESPHRPTLDALLRSLATKRMLLVVDNCEQVIGAVRELAATLVRACPELSLLLTSRELLRISAEHVYTLPPLGVPVDKVASSEEARRFPSVELFVERALAADSHFVLSDANATAVADICRKVDGIPLAIELAAARSAMFAPADLVARLDARLGLLSRAQHDTAPRQRTMRALIDWSYDLLDDAERALFSRLAIFAGGFALDSVTEICSDETMPKDNVLDVLGSLIEKSLVVAEVGGDEGRYRLLEPTRDYALEKLRERGETARLGQRHAETFLRLARHLDDEWYAEHERRWFSRAEAELDNFRAALGFAQQANDPATAPTLTAALARIFYSLAPAEGLRRTQAALDGGANEMPPVLRAWLEIATAEYDNAFGDYKAAAAAAQEALALLKADDAPLLQARAQQAAGAAFAVLGDADGAAAMLQSALTTARKLRRPRLIAVLLEELGTACSRSDDLIAARNFYAQALALCSLHGFERLCASLMAQSGEIAYGSGEPAEALRYAESALSTHRSLRNRRASAAGLCNVTAYLISLDRFDEARDRGREALAAARDVQGRLYTAYALQHLASVAALHADSSHGDGAVRAERAASLLGFVDGRLEALELVRERTEQRTYDRARNALVERLGASTFDKLARQGVEWNDERSIEEALAV
ncbi:MAG: helix-turn-helix domain-containing protein [Candidatus Eremiobacteraeota bacterium]|nr:helix-turn-helix domain-containing protein [Candidatus Eremiobacteraeota bacterium]